MGLCFGSKPLSQEEREAEERSRKIENDNEQDFDREIEKIKLLLLGAGESGNIYKMLSRFFSKYSLTIIHSSRITYYICTHRQKYSYKANEVIIWCGVY